MRAKKVYENLSDILKPKSEEEIEQSIGELSIVDLLIKSSKIGYLWGVQLALNKGADINVQSDIALRWASKKGHTDIVKLLLDRGANIHALDDFALRWASSEGRTNVVKLLLDRGANVHACNDEPLDWASHFGHTDVIDILKKYINNEG